MDAIQSYYTLLNKNNGVELMFLFRISLLHLVNKLFQISNNKLAAPEPKCRNYQMRGRD